MIELSVIVPAMNERERIGPTLVELNDWLSASGLSYEVIVVDDGSTDDTVAFVQTLREVMPRLRVLRGRENRGKGDAVRRGMLAASGRCRVMVDADGSTSADQLGRLLAPVQEGRAEVSIGSRYIQGGVVARRQPWFRRRWSRAVNAVVRCTLVPGVVDTHCGFKAFSGRAARQIFSRCKIRGWAMDLEVLALARHQGFGLEEIPVRWLDDADSRGRPSQMFRAMWDAVRLWWRMAFRSPARRRWESGKERDLCDAKASSG